MQKQARRAVACPTLLSFGWGRYWIQQQMPSRQLLDQVLLALLMEQQATYQSLEALPLVQAGSFMLQTQTTA